MKHSQFLLIAIQIVTRICIGQTEVQIHVNPQLTTQRTLCASSAVRLQPVTIETVTTVRPLDVDTLLLTVITAIATLIYI